MKLVLADTSIWVDHFRKSNAGLRTLIELDALATHPFVIGELACGTPPQRLQTLTDMRLLQHVKQATADEAIAFIEREKLYGKGCGWVDILLLTSTLLTPGALLWTYDQRLESLAEQFGVLYRPVLH
jgi:predicted nucleic acid-binding protein